MPQATISYPSVARAGVLGGFIGAITIDAYLVTVYVVLGHALTLSAFYQYVASAAIGKAAAYGSPASVWLGVALHVVVSIAWGIGFAYVAARTPQVGARPLVSGLVFGAVVMLAMSLVEFAAAVWVFPTIATFEHNVVAHLIFFGVPVAYVAAWTLRRT